MTRKKLTVNILYLAGILSVLLLSSCYDSSINPASSGNGGINSTTPVGVPDTILVRNTGTPRIDSIVFSMPNDATPYLLKIENAPLDYYYVSAANIYLNEEEIFSPNEFNPHVKWLQKQVILKKNNIITVRLRSKPGSAIRIGFGNINTDTSKPTIEIVEPVHNSIIYTDTPVVRVTYKDNKSGINLSTLSIKINGADRTGYFTLTDSTAQWEIPYAFALPTGSNTIKARIANKIGNYNEAVSTFTVVLAKK